MSPECPRLRAPGLLRGRAVAARRRVQVPFLLAPAVPSGRRRPAEEWQNVPPDDSVREPAPYTGEGLRVQGKTGGCHRSVRGGVIKGALPPLGLRPIHPRDTCGSMEAVRGNLTLPCQEVRAVQAGTPMTAVGGGRFEPSSPGAGSRDPPPLPSTSKYPGGVAGGDGGRAPPRAHRPSRRRRYASHRSGRRACVISSACSRRHRATAPWLPEVSTSGIAIPSQTAGRVY